VRTPDAGDGMRSLSENVVCAPMSNVDLWRAIEALASDHWTQEAIATALAVPVRQIKKLRLLANVHPAMLDQIGLGDKGVAIIGDLRSEALRRAIAENAIDDATLIGLLILSLTAQNVSIRTGDYSSSDRRKIAQQITHGGRLTQELDALRQAARQMLATFLSCRPGMNDSGLPARIAGDAIGTDVHLASMASEEFLSCLSKPAIETAASSLGVLARPCAKDTRAELIKAAAGGSFVLPAARFALSADEVARLFRAAALVQLGRGRRGRDPWRRRLLQVRRNRERLRE
jgi:hypothetical protein